MLTQNNVENIAKIKGEKPFMYTSDLPGNIVFRQFTIYIPNAMAAGASYLTRKELNLMNSYPRKIAIKSIRISPFVIQGTLIDGYIPLKIYLPDMINGMSSDSSLTIFQDYNIGGNIVGNNTCFEWSNMPGKQIPDSQQIRITPFSSANFIPALIMTVDIQFYY